MSRIRVCAGDWVERVQNSDYPVPRDSVGRRGWVMYVDGATARVNWVSDRDGGDLDVRTWVKVGSLSVIDKSK